MAVSGAFSALRNRNYRLFWIGNLISNTGDWLDQVALNWLVVSTMESPIWLGLVNLGRGLPILLFALAGGVVADRIDRRRMMMITQSSAMIVAIVLAAAVYTGEAPIWVIVFLATCRGIIVAFNLPARHSLITDLVPRGDIASAVSLNSITNNVAKIAGPLGSGLIISLWGLTACFVVNALTFTVVLLMLFMIRLPAKPMRTAPVEPFITSLRGGFRYVRSNETILLLVLVALVPTFFCQPYLQILAIFAEDVFKVSASDFGIMVSIAAFGSICGGMAAAWIQRETRKGSTMLIFMGAFGASLILFSLSPSVALAMPMLFCAGAMHIAYNASNNTILQMSVDDDYRGRVLSTLFMTRGLVSLGTATMATLAAFVGARAAMSSMAGVVVLFALALWLYSPRLRNLRV